MIKKFLLTMVFVVGTLSIASAQQTYCVNNNGDDLLLGTTTTNCEDDDSQAFATLVQAMSVVLPGDKVYLRCKDQWDEVLMPPSGEQGNPILISGYGECNTKDDYPKIGPTTGKDAVRVDDFITDVQFDKIQAEVNWNGSEGYAFHFRPNTARISLTNFKAVNNEDRNVHTVRINKTKDVYVANGFIEGGNYGLIYIGMPGDNTTGIIEKLIIRNTTHGTAKEWDGIKCAGNDDVNLIVRDIDISGWGEDGVDAIGCKNTQYSNLRIHDSAGIFSSTNGIKLCSNLADNNCSVRDSVIWNVLDSDGSGGTGITMGSSGSGQKIINVITINTNGHGAAIASKNVLVDGFIVINTGTSGHGIRWSNGGTGKVINSIFDATKHDMGVFGVGTVVTGDNNYFVNEGNAFVGQGGVYFGGPNDK